MSAVAIFEIDSELSIDEIRSRLQDMNLKAEISELSKEDLANPRISQSKRIEVYVPVYLSSDEEVEIMKELQRMAEVLLGASDGEMYYYRSSHAQEKDAEQEFISIMEIERIPPTLHEPRTKRYVLRRSE